MKKIINEGHRFGIKMEYQLSYPVIIKSRKTKRLSECSELIPYDRLRNLYTLNPGIINNIHLYISEKHLTIKVEHDYGNMFVIMGITKILREHVCYYGNNKN